MPADFFQAQICENGHVIAAELDNYPGLDEKYCSRCGAVTLKVCRKCSLAIRGPSRYADFDASSYVCPAYCPDCGSAYPWTERALEAAEEFTHELGISEDDAVSLVGTFPVLASDSPQTAVAASRFRRIVSKAGPMAADGFKSILVNVVTEAAKKMMFPFQGAELTLGIGSHQTRYCAGGGEEYYAHAGYCLPAYEDTMSDALVNGKALTPGDHACAELLVHRTGATVFVRWAAHFGPTARKEIMAHAIGVAKQIPTKSA